VGRYLTMEGKINMKWNLLFGRKKKRIVIIAFLVIVLIVTAAIVVPRVLNPLPSILPSDAHRIIVIGKTNQDISFWLSLRSGVDVAAKEFGVNYEYWSPDVESDLDKQISLVYKAIEEKPDIIILAASDYERLSEPAKAVVDAGIPLITLDSTVNGNGKQIGSCFVATDNVAAGVKAGEAMQALLPEGKVLAVISPLIGTNSSKDRDRGVRQGLDPDTIALPTADSAGSEDIAYQLASEILKNPDIGGIVCLNEYATVGAARAISGAGLSGKIILVGFDSSPSLNTYLEEGCLTATVIQRPFNMGYVAMANAVSILNGKRIDPFYDTGSILVTKDTMYLEENEKLLFPFT